MLELVDKDFAAAIINMFEGLKDKMSQWLNIWEIPAKNQIEILDLKMKHQKWKNYLTAYLEVGEEGLIEIIKSEE